MDTRGNTPGGVSSLVGEGGHICNTDYIYHIQYSRCNATLRRCAQRLRVVSPSPFGDNRTAMAVASELVAVAPGLRIWQAYDPAVKADLYSSAVATRHGLYLVDPIPLDHATIGELLDLAPLAAVVVTNANHLRAAPQFAEEFSVPLFARPESLPNETKFDLREIADGDEITDEVRVIGIDGAVIGEIALYHAPNGGTLILGDALINFEPYGFDFLPEKYCSDQKQMRRSLRKLLAHHAERMLFAHGTPITSRAGERLARLLDVDL